MNHPPTASAALSAGAPGRAAEEGALLEVEGLKTYFYTLEGVSRAVDGVSFSMRPAETLGLVGESGCGKSVTSLSILRLVPSPPGRIVEGAIRFRGEDLLALPERRMRAIRGAKISMIFQEPMTSLNPVFTIGDQVAEAFRAHRGLGRRAALDEAARMLDLVRIPSARARLREYPHQLSGGMRQRVMIAMALACDPDLLIADEPTTALDVTVQAQILELMESLQRRFRSAILLITHDLGVVAETCDRVAVMYAGQIVEQAPARTLFRRPAHPYTLGLLEALPRRESGAAGAGARLRPIPGNVPSPLRYPAGCRFHPRCPFAEERCAREAPGLAALDESEGHWARCLFAREIAAGARERRADISGTETSGAESKT